jgi:hypothetical protein
MPLPCRYHAVTMPLPCRYNPKVELSRMDVERSFMESQESSDTMMALISGSAQARRYRPLQTGYK